MSDHEIRHREIHAGTDVALRADGPGCNDGRQSVGRDEVGPCYVYLCGPPLQVSGQVTQRCGRLEVVGICAILGIRTVGAEPGRADGQNVWVRLRGHRCRQPKRGRSFRAKVLQHHVGGFDEIF